MKISDSNIDHIFEFSGSLGMLSKCGLKIKRWQNKTVVIATELYQDNPGTSITSVTASLAKQICEAFSINLQSLIYLECAPKMNSKLSFYDETYFKVDFDIINNQFENPKWIKLTQEEIKSFFSEMQQP